MAGIFETDVNNGVAGEGLNKYGTYDKFDINPLYSERNKWETSAKWDESNWWIKLRDENRTTNTINNR